MPTLKFKVQYTDTLPQATNAIAFNPTEINIDIVQRLVGGGQGGSDLIEIEMTLHEWLTPDKVNYNMQHKLMTVPAAYIDAVFQGQPIDVITLQPIANQTALNQILAAFKLQLA